MAAKEGDGELRPLGFATGDRSRSQSREGGGGRDSRETSRDYRDLPSGEREGERERDGKRRHCGRRDYREKKTCGREQIRIDIFRVTPCLF
jgi:hypothetical protein